MSRITQRPGGTALGSSAAAFTATMVASAMVGSLFQRAKVLFRQSEPEATAVPPRKVANLYHAVEVVPGKNACPEARALQGQRFLSREAPSLPLAGCGSLLCTCRYEHHEDRRKGGRRARDLAVAIDGYCGEEQRDETRRGRRKSDRR